MIFKTQRTYENVRSEVSTLPTLTVPDQSLTVREILDNFTRGLPIPGDYEPYYSNTDDFDSIPSNPDPMQDLSDLDDARAYSAQVLEKAKAEQEAFDKKEREAYEQFLKSKDSMDVSDSVEKKDV